MRQETLALAQEQASASAMLAVDARMRIGAYSADCLENLVVTLDPLAAEAAALATAMASTGAGRGRHGSQSTINNPVQNPSLFPRADKAAADPPAGAPAAVGVPARRGSGLLPDDPIVPTPMMGGAAGLVTPVGPPAAAASARFDALRVGGGGAFGGLIRSPAAAANGRRLENGGVHDPIPNSGMGAHELNPNPGLSAAHAPVNATGPGYSEAPHENGEVAGRHLGGSGDTGGEATLALAEESGAEGFAEAKSSRRRGPRRKRGGAGGITAGP